MAFDAKKHIIRIQGGREYLPVAARLIWFRDEHPDWSIITNPIEINMERQYAIFACMIVDAEGKTMATATKMENVRGFGDWLEKAETGSVGRALAYCGYGTQFAPDLDDEVLADQPHARENTADAPAPDGRRSGASPHAPAGSVSSSRCSCGECQNQLTSGQYTTSMRKYGAPFCLLHQRNATPIASHPANRQNGSQHAYPTH